MRKFIVFLSLVFVLISSVFSLSIDDSSISYTEKFNFLKTLSLNDAIRQLKESEFSKTIVIEKLSEFEKVSAGKKFTKEAKARFTIKDGETVTELSNIEVFVKYPTQEQNTTSFQVKKLITDEKGLLSFSLESFDFPLLQNVVFYLLPCNELETLEFDEVSHLLQEVNLENLFVSFPVKVSGKKKSGLKTTIDIVDFNEQGYAFSRNMVGTALLGEFMTRGYLWPGIFESSVLKKYGADFKTAVDGAKSAFGGNINEYILGQSRISWETKDNTHICTCTATIQVWDMASLELITEFTGSVSIETNKKNSDIESQARQKLGKTVLADFFEFNFEFK